MMQGVHRRLRDILRRVRAEKPAAHEVDVREEAVYRAMQEFVDMTMEELHRMLREIYRREVQDEDV